MSEATVLVGDCREVMAGMPAESVDALVSDPPAGISFMGKSWDSNKGSRNAWIAWLTEVMEEAFRVMKPGAHGLVWALPRTSHWTAMALEDAGFQIRDRVAHIHGQGFPKNLDVGKQIDKLNGKHLVDLSTFGEYVKERRKAKGWSLRELDERMGTNTAASWWEGRKSGVQLPSLQTYKRLKEVLDLDNQYDALIEWAEAEREVLGKSDELYGRKSGIGNETNGHYTVGGTKAEAYDITAPATEEAKRWQGFGTALKPSTEDWWLIRKPLSEKNVASQVLKTGTGALAIDRCRVQHASPSDLSTSLAKNPGREDTVTSGVYGKDRPQQQVNTSGRWPPNLLLSHSPGCRPTGEIRRVKPGNGGGYVTKDSTKGMWGVHSGKGHVDPDGYEGVEEYLCVDSCPVRLMDLQSGQLAGRGSTLKKREKTGNENVYGKYAERKPQQQENNGGGASRFFPRFPLEPEAPFLYSAKASKRERDAGLDEIPEQLCGMMEDDNYPIKTGSGNLRETKRRNTHPTVKSLAVMDWLVKLVTPPGGTCLDPFMGSGSTGCSAVRLGFNFIGIEQDPEYAEIARRRIAHWSNIPDTRSTESKNGKAPAPKRNTYGFASTDVVRRCPEHGESIPSGSTTYKCGCAKVWTKREDVIPEAPSQTPLETLF